MKDNLFPRGRFMKAEDYSDGLPTIQSRDGFTEPTLQRAGALAESLEGPSRATAPAEPSEVPKTKGKK